MGTAAGPREALHQDESYRSIDNAEGLPEDGYTHGYPVDTIQLEWRREGASAERIMQIAAEWGMRIPLLAIRSTTSIPTAGC